MESDGAHDRDANPADPRLSDPDAGSASGTGPFDIGVFLPEARGRTDGGSAEPESDFSKQDTQQ